MGQNSNDTILFVCADKTFDDILDILRDMNEEWLGDVFWQIAQYAESNNWEPTYNITMLAFAMTGET